jgi:hypothetical protein
VYKLIQNATIQHFCYLYKMTRECLSAQTRKWFGKQYSLQMVHFIGDGVKTGLVADAVMKSMYSCPGKQMTYLEICYFPWAICHCRCLEES